MMVPAEFIGKARAFRRSVTAGHFDAFETIARIKTPFVQRHRLRQPPTTNALARAAATWRDIPGPGRLALSIKLTKTRLAITETRAGPAEFRFDAWSEGEMETAVLITQTTMTVSAGHLHFEVAPIASVPLHALARRYQRGWTNTETAIRADLLALVVPAADVIDRGDNFAVPVTDGLWVGGVVAIEHFGEPAAIMVVRTFRDAGMRVKTAPVETVGAEL
jgi:hypothetical protein